jgi:hypothetical protein
MCIRTIVVRVGHIGLICELPLFGNLPTRATDNALAGTPRQAGLAASQVDDPASTIMPCPASADGTLTQQLGATDMRQCCKFLETYSESSQQRCSVDSASSRHATAVWEGVLSRRPMWLRVGTPCQWPAAEQRCHASYLLQRRPHTNNSIHLQSV